jgi:hypothetical protein
VAGGVLIAPTQSGLPWVSEECHADLSPLIFEYTDRNRITQRGDVARGCSLKVRRKSAYAPNRGITEGVIDYAFALVDGTLCIWVYVRENRFSSLARVG